MSVYEKQVADVEDMVFDFASWVSSHVGMTITDHVVDSDEGITVVSSQLSGSKVTVVVSGGTKNHGYKVTVRAISSTDLEKEIDAVMVVMDD